MGKAARWGGGECGQGVPQPPAASAPQMRAPRMVLPGLGDSLRLLRRGRWGQRWPVALKQGYGGSGGLADGVGFSGLGSDIQPA